MITLLLNLRFQLFDLVIKFINLRSIVVQECKAVGFKYVSLDLDGYRSGSANEDLVMIQ